MMEQARKRQKRTMFIFLFCTSLVCRGVYSATNTTPATSSTAGATGSSASNSTGSSATNSTSAPDTNATGSSATNSTSAPATNATSSSATNSTSAPATNATSSSATNATSSSATNSTSASATNTTGSSATNSTSAPATSATSSPATSATSASAINATGSSATNSTSAPATNATSSSAVNSTSAPATNATSSSATNSTSASATNTTGSSATSATSASAINATGSSATNSTSASAINATGSSATNSTSASATNATGSSATNSTSAPASNPTVTGNLSSVSPESSSSAEPEASSTSSTAASPTVSTPLPFVQFVKKSDLTVAVHFTIKFNRTFNKDLYNKNSTQFKNTSSQYEADLTTVFNKTHGFKSVNVTGFWDGSIGVDYTVQYDYSAAEDAQNFKSNLTSVAQDLEKLHDVDTAYINATFDAEINLAYSEVIKVKGNPCSAENACRPHWTCTNPADNETEIKCTSPCNGFHCQASGICFIDSNGKPRCRCPLDNKYVYGGEQCEQKAEKLDLPSTTIIAIACGAGGGIILILIIALVCTCRSRRRRSGKAGGYDDQKSEASFQSLTGMQGMSTGPALNSNRLYRQQSEEDPAMAATFLRQDSGLPKDALDRPEIRPNGTRPEEPSSSGQMRYGEDGRMYKVVKDSHIYGPGAFRNPAFESFPEETSLSDRRLSQSGFNRLSQHGGPREHVYDQLKEDERRQSQSMYCRLEQPEVPRKHVYSDMSDETFVYQPSDVTARSHVPNMSYLNPIMIADPNELSGFPRHDDVRRQDDVTSFSDNRSQQRDSIARYSDRPQESYRRDEHPGAPVKVYPDKEPVYPVRDAVYPARGSSELGYPGKEREEVRYAKPMKAALPGGMDDGLNPLVHDFSDRGLRQQQDMRPSAERAKVYDYVPKGKVAIQRPGYSNRPLY